MTSAVYKVGYDDIDVTDVYSDQEISVITGTLGINEVVLDDVVNVEGVSSTTSQGDQLAHQTVNGGSYVYVKSMGNWTTDSDTTYIDMNSRSHVTYSKPMFGNYSTGYYVYNSVDASAATGEVTYIGLDEKYWQMAHGSAYEDKMLYKAKEDGLNGSAAYRATYEYHNIFKGGDYGNTIYGGSYADTLIGGAGDDYIDGSGGADFIVGYGGDNTLIGGAGDDTIFGGTHDDGSDYIVTGTGNNTVVLSSGDNFVVVQQNEISDGETTSYTNNIVSGSGEDTFIIGNIPASETVSTSTLNEYIGDVATAADLKATECTIHAATEALEFNPVAGIFVSTAFTALDAILGGSASTETTTTEWPSFDSSYIYNFNPLEDRLIMPMGEGTVDALQVTAGGATDDYDVEITNGQGDVVLRLTLEDDLLGSDHTLTQDEKAAFAYSMIDTAFVVSGDEVTYGTDTVVDPSVYEDSISTSLSDEMGSSKFMYLGNWGGNYITGMQSYSDTSAPIYMGSNYDDIFYPFDSNDETKSDSGDNAVYYGFEGNDLYVVGTGNDRINAGDGDNTVSFELSDYAITTDMSDDARVLDAQNTDHGLALRIDKGTSNFTYAWGNVENIKGSLYDDTITGDDADNTFYSTGGENTWTGGDGADTFIIDGGSSTVTDFVSSEDVIKVYVDAYVDTSDTDFTGGETDLTDAEIDVAYMSKLTWSEGDDGSWTLHDDYNDTDLVTIENDDGLSDTPPDVTVYTGTSDTSGLTDKPYYDSVVG